VAGSIEYPPGTPSWADLASPDVEASARFYGELLGWEAREMGSVEETGGYRNFYLGDDAVAGVTPLQEGTGPPHWNTYITVADVEETIGKVENAGGQSVMGPLDVLDVGRMAIFADAAGGGFFCIWQPGTHRGAQAVNRVGAMAWNELDTRDMAAAERFYGQVFGWESEPIESDGEVVYATWKLGGRTIGGLLPMGDRFPPEVPANWVVYFGLEDLDAAAGTIERLGGRVLVAGQQMPQGRFAVYADPHGAVFAGWEGTYDPPPGG
jgi:predicted enzyme related to lactoylglutathione lyase